MGRNNKNYLVWILKQVVPDRDMRDLYSKTFEYLLDTEFYLVLEKDDNRLYRGLNLRTDYSDSHGGKWTEWMKKAPCSLLEVMVGLAKSAENMMYDEEIGDRTHEWFWAMMENSGLINYPNSEFDEEKIGPICHKIMDRTYDFDGKGGLFWTKNNWGDMRETELWYQMCWWLTENVPL